MGSSTRTSRFPRPQIDKGGSHEQARTRSARQSGVSRRAFLKGSGAAAAASALAAGPGLAAEEQKTSAVVAGKTTITLNVNGQAAEGRSRAAHHAARSAALRPESDRRQADQRRRLQRRQHGAGRRQAGQRQHDAGHRMRRQEDSRRPRAWRGDKLDPVAAAFVHHDATQCGFCTPGFVVAVQGLSGQEPQGDRGRDSRGPERQPLPLRHLRQHHSGGPRRGERRLAMVEYVWPDRKDTSVLGGTPRQDRRRRPSAPARPSTATTSIPPRC